MALHPVVVWFFMALFFALSIICYHKNLHKAPAPLINFVSFLGVIQGTYLSCEVMTVSDDLFQLIKSLNKNEKTYFKKFAQLHVLGEENNYILLFDAVDEQQKYDEKKLAEKFSKGKSASQFSVLKNYLYNLILKSLRNFHAEVTVRAELRQQLQNTSILFERGLHGQAQKLLRRCRKTAEENELFRELIEISGLEQVVLLFGKSYDDHTIKTLNGILDERKLILEKMQNSYDYDRIEYNLSHCLQFTKTGSGEAAKQMKHELLKNEKKALCVISRLKFHHIHATYFYYTTKRKECLAHMVKEVEILEAHPGMMLLRLQDYVLLNNNILLLLREQNDLKKFDQRLQQFREKIAGYTISTRLWEQAMAQSYLVEMQRHYFDFNYSKILSVSAELEKQLKANKASLKLNDLFVYLDLLCRASFLAKKFNTALEYSIQLLNHVEVPQKFSQYHQARLFNLLIHFELGNFDLLDYQIQSFQRQIMKVDKNNAVYNVLIPFLKKYPSATGKKQKQLLVSKLVKEIPDGDSYFNFSSWAKAKEK